MQEILQFLTSFFNGEVEAWMRQVLIGELRKPRKRAGFNHLLKICHYNEHAQPEIHSVWFLGCPLVAALALRNFRMIRFILDEIGWSPRGKKFTKVVRQAKKLIGLYLPRERSEIERVKRSLILGST